MSSYLHTLFFIATISLIGCNDKFVILSQNLIEGTQLEGLCVGSGDGLPGCSLKDLKTFSVVDPNVTPSISTDISGLYIVNNGIQSRITNEGFRFIEEHINEIINSSLQNGDPSDTPHICLDGATEFSDIGILGDGKLTQVELCPKFLFNGEQPECDGQVGKCRLDLKMDSIVFQPSDQVSDSRKDFDSITLRAQLDLGLGVNDVDSEPCAEPPIDRGCKGNDPECACPGSSGIIPLNAKKVLDIGLNQFEIDVCDLAIGANNLLVDITLNFDTDLATSTEKSSRESFFVANVNIVSDLDDKDVFDIAFFSLGRETLFGHDVCQRVSFLLLLDDILNGDVGLEETIGNAIGNAIEDSLDVDPNRDFDGTDSNLPRAASRISLPILQNALNLTAFGTGVPREQSLFSLSGIFDLILSVGDYTASEQQLGVSNTNPLSNGLSFGIRSGISNNFSGTPGTIFGSSNPCVQPFLPPKVGSPVSSNDFPFLNLGEQVLNRNAGFASNTIPDTTIEYDASIGISDGILDMVVYNLYNSGVLCLVQLGLKKLVDGNIPIGATLNTDILVNPNFDPNDPTDPDPPDLLPSLRPSLLKNGVVETHPLFITTRPIAPPDFKFGDGVPGDPLIQLLLPMEFDVGIAIDNDTITTLFTVTIQEGDRIGLNLDIEPPVPSSQRGTLLISLDSDEFDSINLDVVLRSSLLTESQPELQIAAKSFLQFILNHITQNMIGPINLPNIRGITLDSTQTTIKKVDGPGLGGDFIGLFADFLFLGNNALQAPLVTQNVVQTQANLLHLDLPGPFDTNRVPAVTLALGGDSRELEWQLRVDNQMWRSFTPNQNPVVRDPAFLLGGEHQISVRARQQKRPGTLDPTPVILSLRIGEEPTLETEVTTEEAGCSVSPARRMGSSAIFGWCLFLWVLLPGKTRKNTSRASAYLSCLSLVTLLCFGCTNPEISKDEEQEFGQPRHNNNHHGNGNGNGNNSGITCQLDADCVSLSCNSNKVKACESSSGSSSRTCKCVNERTIPEGDIGQFLDLAVFQNSAYVVAYNQTYGDLMFARVKIRHHDGEEQGDDHHGNGNGYGHDHHNDDEQDGDDRFQTIDPQDWLFLDGVPSGPIVGSRGRIRGGVRDPGTDVGQYTSIAVDADGNAHIAYFDVSNGDLKYARVKKGKRIATVQTIDTHGVVGLFTDILIGPDGTPQISYMADSDTIIGATKTSQLKFIKAHTRVPFSSGDWDSPRVVDSVTAPVTSTSLKINPLGTGLYTSMALSSEGKTLILYYDSKHADSLLAASAGVSDFTFSHAQLDQDNSQNDLGNVGLHSSLLVGSSARHYTMKADGTFIYFSNEQNQWELIEPVFKNNSSGTPVRQQSGAGATLLETVLNGVPSLFAVYQDGLENTFAISKRTNSGWVRTDLIEEGEREDGDRGAFLAASLLEPPSTFVLIADYVRTLGAATNHVEFLLLDLSSLP